MAVICNRRVPADLVEWDGHESSTAASYLGRVDQELFSRVYDGACDVGIVFVNPRTGNEAVFAVTHQEVRDGYLLYWTLEPIAETVREFPNLKNVRIRVFNDD